MVAADRELRLAGYEVYRFGGYEFTSRDQAASLLDKFFDDVPLMSLLDTYVK